jgi:hypothetical protein
VPYRLLLPRTPSPVDLMFLVDTTASTDRTLNAVRQDLGRVVDELGSIGLDAQFGVADFRDYSSDDLGNGESGDYPYRLRRAIGPVNSALRAALNGLHSGGGGDSDEADLTALYQSTLGTGQYVTDVDGHHVRVVRAGQQAGYRSDSLRLAIIATDAAYHKEASYPTPSWASTVAALRAHGVHQVGLAVQTVLLDGTPTGFDSKHDEQLMARDTGALAPFGGVDCDGNGTVDVAQGAPLVCPIPQPKSQQTTIAGKVTVGPPPAPLHLANAIVDLAANIPDLRAVGLQVHGGPASLASVVSTPGAPTVNVRADNTLSYTVRFTCPVAVTGKNYSLTLDAVAGVRTVTSASTDLQCGGQPKPGVIPPVAPIAAAAVAAAPGGPPNPPAQGNANPNPNPALNANAGFAQQEDEEKQLAFADADQGAALDDENAMAMSRRPSTAEEAWMAGAAGMMMAGAGYATRRRWRTAYNRG